MEVAGAAAGLWTLPCATPADRSITSTSRGFCVKAFSKFTRPHHPYSKYNNFSGRNWFNRSKVQGVPEPRKLVNKPHFN